MSELAQITEKQVASVITLPGHKKKLLLALQPVRTKCQSQNVRMLLHNYVVAKLIIQIIITIRIMNRICHV